jgi:hypothetical protein
MKKPTLDSAPARKAPPEPGSAPLLVTKAVKGDDGKLAISLRMRETLAKLKLLALQQRTRLNDIIFEGIENHLALHGRRIPA